MVSTKSTDFKIQPGILLRFYRNGRPRSSHNDIQCKLLVGIIVNFCKNKYFLLYN